MSEDVDKRRSNRWVSTSKDYYNGADWESDYSGDDLDGSPRRQNTINKLPELPKLRTRSQSTSPARASQILGGEQAKDHAMQHVFSSDTESNRSVDVTVDGASSGTRSVDVDRKSQSAGIGFRGSNGVGKDLGTLMAEISKEMGSGSAKSDQSKQSERFGSASDDTSNNDGSASALRNSLGEPVASGNEGKVTERGSQSSTIRRTEAPSAKNQSLSRSAKSVKSHSSVRSPGSEFYDDLSVNTNENATILGLDSDSDVASPLPPANFAKPNTPSSFATNIYTNADELQSMPSYASPEGVVSNGRSPIRLKLTSKTDLSYRYDDTTSEDISVAGPPSTICSGILDSCDELVTANQTLYRSSANTSSAQQLRDAQFQTASAKESPRFVGTSENTQPVAVPNNSDDNLLTMQRGTKEYVNENTPSTIPHGIQLEEPFNIKDFQELHIKNSVASRQSSGEQVLSANSSEDNLSENRSPLESKASYEENPKTSDVNSQTRDELNTTVSIGDAAISISDDGDESELEGFPQLSNYAEEDLNSLEDERTIYDNHTLLNVPAVIANYSELPPLPSNAHELSSLYMSPRETTQQRSGQNTPSQTFAELGSTPPNADLPNREEFRSASDQLTSDIGYVYDNLRTPTTHVNSQEQGHLTTTNAPRTLLTPDISASRSGSALSVSKYEVDSIANGTMPSLDLCKILEGNQTHAMKLDLLRSHMNDLESYDSGTQKWIAYALKSTQGNEESLQPEYVVNKHVHDAYAQAEEMSKKHSVTDTVNQNVYHIKKKVFSHNVKGSAKVFLSSIGKKW